MIPFLHVENNCFSWGRGTACWEITLKATVYGKRDGVLTGLAITAKDSKNYFHSTKGWKTGTVLDVDMCQRGDMYKPEQATRPS